MAFGPVVELSSLDGANGFRISGELAYDSSGRSVSGAGDVNGDGFADLIVGAFGADPNASYSGASYVVFGRAGSFAPNLDLSTLNGANGFQISGEAAGDRSGFSVSSAGDVNGDGFADLVVGAPFADPNGGSSGASYVVFGHAPDAAVSRVGSAADQVILGGAFADTLDGQGGDDTLEGGGGGDSLIGGAGRDTASYKHAAGGVVVDLTDPANGAGDAAGDTYTDIERFRLSGEDDGFVGADANDRVQGGAGSDSLSGGVGADTLGGGAGADTLAGGSGRDLLFGGAGADTFVFADMAESPHSAGRDRIAGFVAGEDQLDLRLIDADPQAGGDQAFALLGTGAFTGAGGEVRFGFANGRTAVLADLDGDRGADLRIVLDGAVALTEADFLL